MTDTDATVVKFRDPRPPHGEQLIELVADVQYGFKVRKTGTCAFQVARSSPNLRKFLESMIPTEPAMVTIERRDGYLPWVGFVTQYDAALADAEGLIQGADHSWRLAAPHGARTRKNQFFKTAGGRIIKDVFRDMEDRGEPAPMLLYDNVADGPLANHEVRADFAFDLLETVAQQTDYEWCFSHNVSKGVDTHLGFVYRQGNDRRHEEVWQEQKHFVTAGHTITYANGVKAAFMVGGSGTFAGRPALVVNAGGSAPDVTAYPKRPVSAYGLGGTRSVVTEQITDPSVLRQRAIQLHEAPEWAVEQIRLKLFEDAVDMSRFGLGDYRTIRMATTSLGTAIERSVRVIGIQMIPKAHEIDVEVIAV